MNEAVSRRRFLGGLGAAGLGLVLADHLAPTEASGDDKPSEIPATGWSEVQAPTQFRPTVRQTAGPFHRSGAPFRAKITPPFAEGTVMLICGQVWGHDSKKPLAAAMLDVWQANHRGRYDNDADDRPPKRGVFHNRARMLTDEHGYYEFETVHPGRYQLVKDVYRPAHIHFSIAAKGYRTLTTQLYFKGDPWNAKDSLIKKSLIIPLVRRKVGKQQYEYGEFHIVLAAR